MKYEPVLCDFDGTLADSAPVIVRAIKAACEELGVSIPPGADLSTCVGPPLERAFPAVLGEGAPIPELIESYRRHYIRTAPTQTVLMPDALATIQAWHRSGIRIGVVSYKPLPVLDTVLQGLGLTQYLSVVRAPDIGKPPPSKTGLSWMRSTRYGRSEPNPYSSATMPTTSGPQEKLELISSVTPIVLGTRSRESLSAPSGPECSERIASV